MDLFDSELWLPVVGYEGYYEVSNLGRVRSLPRIKSNGQSDTVWIPGIILRPAPQRRGYLTVNLHAGDRKRTGRVHQLVLAAFVGPCPDGMEVLHRNDIPGDNRLANLYYGTRSENCIEAFTNGRRGIWGAPLCPCGYEFADDDADYRDPNNGLRACVDCRSTWRERHPVYAAA